MFAENKRKLQLQHDAILILSMKLIVLVVLFYVGTRQIILLTSMNNLTLYNNYG